MRVYLKNFNNFPFISIITVCRNAVDFIEQTIVSVLSQTYPRKEYIIIDGCSTDGTVDIIRRYESQLAYWHSQPDRGLAHAFNLGFEHSRGDWIIYLHADDFFLDTTVLEKMAPYLQAHDQADVVIGQVVRMLRQQIPQPIPFFTLHAIPWHWWQFRRVCTMPHQAAFTHRRYFQRAGPFDESFKIALDYEFFLRAGADLHCPYVPIAVSGMRVGGLGTRTIHRTLQESRQAQLKNRALPPWFSLLNMYATFIHWQVNGLVYRFMERFGERIFGPDKGFKINN
jgi:glycosyltransferase involved in cell wall biosynthesis